MSAYDEYRKEKEAIDELLAAGYAVVAVREDLDGSAVRFKRTAPEVEIRGLQLLTADARKYVVALLFAARTEESA